MLIGREKESKILTDALHSKQSELIAVYGRRRVGKTYLIRNIYHDALILECIGMHKASLKTQLEQFKIAIQSLAGTTIPIETPKNWSQAFLLLQRILENISATEKKKVIFFDELPWLATKKSGFLTAFGHFWNSWVSKRDDYVIVICGSAASWMITNIVRDKGGLHNRITKSIRLLPFNLYETEKYLLTREVSLDKFQLLQLYMAIGGIPQYLNAVERGESATQIIDNLYFGKNNILRGEFDILYNSLFENAATHISIIKALAAKTKGLTRQQIIENTQYSTGGTISTVLFELQESGFIQSYLPFGKKNKDAIFKLTDELSLFHLRFIQPAKNYHKGNWQQIALTSTYKSWCGYAFENICLKHINQVKQALNIGGVITSESVWNSKGDETHNGAQIDLLIDRADKTINLCEIKFSETEYTITKSYAEELDKKVRVFKEVLKPRKTIFKTLITTYGVKKNNYYSGVDKEITMDALFLKDL